ncbi:MAG TPA: helix-turn-helix domain-containing protein [Methanobacteriaceae archaeon]|nr:helix-turn-helix domain-containing protein [Methanobacteriaceae archaeon]
MVKEIYVAELLTIQRIMNLLEQYPDLERIKCPPSLYARTSPKYLDALKTLGIEVKPEQRKGRPPKYTQKEISQINQMSSQGNTPQQIAQNTGIPLKSVYHLIKNPLKHPGKKYGPQTIIKVKELHKKGMGARKISDEMEIPLRSVYFLLKKAN